MSWNPAIVDNPLVCCSLQPRSGVRFDLYLTEEYICYSRVKTFAVTDPLETVTIDRASVSHVSLKRKSPWLLRIVGIFLILSTSAAVISFMVGSVERFQFVLLLGYVIGGACFFGSSNRWQLSFSDGRKIHTIVQPVASDKKVMNEMAAALQETNRFLSMGAAT